MTFVQRLDVGTSRLREKLLQSLWWESVGRPGSRVGKVTGKYWGRYQGVKKKQGDQLQGLFRSPGKSWWDLIRAQGEKWVAAFVLVFLD